MNDRLHRTASKEIREGRMTCGAAVAFQRVTPRSVVRPIGCIVNTIRANGLLKSVLHETVQFLSV